MKSSMLPPSVPHNSTPAPGSPDLPVGLAQQLRASLAKAPASAADTRTRKPVRLLLVDDHPVVRKGISFCLQGRGHLQIVGEAANGQEAVVKARELKPDVVLMDIDLPQLNGLAVTELLRKELPQIRVLILSIHTNPEYVLRILQSGARGYVLKDATPEELVRAIDAISSGETFFSPEAARAALNQYVRGGVSGNAPQLTQREREVLIQIAEGLSNKEVASKLGVGVRTVETHRERIMKKLDIHSVAGLTKYALNKGLITLNSNQT